MQSPIDIAAWSDRVPALMSATLNHRSLRQLGVPQWPSQANFILVKIGPKHAEFVQAMQRRGILTRDRSKDQGCAGCVRLTVGTRDQMGQAVAAMAEALNEIGWEKA